MNSLTISLTQEYLQRIDALTQAGCPGQRCWIDADKANNGAAEVRVSEKSIQLSYRSAGRLVQESCSYGAVKSVVEMRDGLLLNLSRKRFLFLPAAENAEHNKALADIFLMLDGTAYSITREKRLQLSEIGIRRQLALFWRPTRKLRFAGGSLGFAEMIILTVVLLFAAAAFMLPGLTSYTVDREEAIPTQAVYEGYDISRRHRSLRYFTLHFTDGTSAQVDGCCSGVLDRDGLDKLYANTEIDLLMHPKSGVILEIEASGDILLEFDEAQEALRAESAGFMVLSGLMLAVAVIVIASGFVRKQKRK